MIQDGSIGDGLSPTLKLHDSMSAGGAFTLSMPSVGLLALIFNSFFLRAMRLPLPGSRSYHEAEVGHQQELRAQR